MTDREKLFKLIEDGRLCPEDGCPFEEEKCMQCKYREDRDCDITRLADYLISNGVTFATDTNVGGKWIPVTERLPDELPKDGSAWSERVRPSVDVLVKMKGLKELYTAWYSYSRKEWIDTSETHNLGDSVIYWMPLPEPPKEEPHETP